MKKLAEDSCSFMRNYLQNRNTKFSTISSILTSLKVISCYSASSNGGKAETLHGHKIQRNATNRGFESFFGLFVSEGFFPICIQLTCSCKNG